MGHFSIRCMVSGMTIDREESCVMIPMINITDNSSGKCYSNGQYSCIGLAVKGKYNEYGFIENVENPNIVDINTSLFDIDKTENDHGCTNYYGRKILYRETWMKPLQCIKYDYNLHYGKGDHIELAFIKREVFDYIISKVKKEYIDNVNIVKNFRKIESILKENDYDNNLMRDIMGNCIGFNSNILPDDFFYDDKVMCFDAYRHLCDTGRHIFSNDFKRRLKHHIFDAYIFKKIEIPDELLNAIQEMIVFNEACETFGNIIMPSNSICSQDFDRKLEQKEIDFLEFHLKLRKDRLTEYKREYGYDYTEE